MKLVPLGDRVVLKQLVAEETTKSGIVLTGQAKEKPQEAEVIAVGPGGVVDGKEVKMEVSVGRLLKATCSGRMPTQYFPDGQASAIGRHIGASLIIWSPIERLPFSYWQEMMFMDGEPMNRAQKILAGILYTWLGVSSISIFPRYMMATRCPTVMASIWS